ncbi:unnamed protein product [Urochloa humidicola]
MASEDGALAAAAVFAEAVNARAAELVRALLRPGPGGALSVEAYADFVAYRDRASIAWIAREFPAARPEEIDILAVAKAAAPG